MPNSPKVVITAAANTTFSSILLYFPFYRNYNSKYIIRPYK